MLKPLFTRRWLLASVLVLAGFAVLVRLGVWQLDRLEWRRALNARVMEQQAAPTLMLEAGALDLDLYSMEYRRATVRGQYLPEHEIVLRNQVWLGETGNQLGVDLYTPLLIEGTNQAILVERGWIPQEDAQQRGAYIEDGLVTVFGQLRRAETDFGLGRSLQPDPTTQPGERLEIWNNLDLPRLADQMDVELLPVYLQRIPQGQQTAPPYASVPQMDLSEGSHFGYAVQWFIFASLLLVGYPFYVRRQEAKKNESNG